MPVPCATVRAVRRAGLHRLIPVLILTAVATTLPCEPVVGAEPEAADSIRRSGFAALDVMPREIRLDGSRARQQILVSALPVAVDEAQPGHTLPPTADVTRQATYESLSPVIADVTSSGLVLPRGFGEARIRVRWNGLEATIGVTVTRFGQADPVDFRTDVIAALSRAGCNSGACHGSPQGKNGFRLSLRGFDPQLDFGTLARETQSRRTNPVSPDDSLLLKKPLGDLPHQGGIRLSRTDSAWQLLRTWIAEGCRPSRTERELVRLEVLPANRRLPEEFPAQQLVALAHFADGSVRDVTDIAVFTSNDDAAASISPDGLVEFDNTADGTFLVRYLSQVVGARLSYVKHDADFDFVAPAAVNVVDRHVFSKQRALQISPAPLTTDAEFLRRVYLDTIGVPPTVGQAAAFLDSTATDKRARLIDELLERDEYAYHWALKWADVMRGSEVTISSRGVHSFHRYLVDRVRHDRPFDEFARETLTGLGSTLNNPAASFHRIARTPEDSAEAMSQLFLGVRIGCARCHNHPFEAITQEDYYGFAAYFARVKFKGRRFGLDDEVVYLDRRGDVRHPVTNQIVPPIAFGVSAGEVGPDDDPRERLVDWLVAPENPWFARSIVNRLWYHLLGRGIVDPVDDFRDTNPPSNPELLDALAAEFSSSGYRMKPVLRTILNSATYQLSSHRPERQSPRAANPEQYFASSVVRMLNAEQILDAVSSATGLPETFPGYPSGTRAVELADGAVEHTFLQAFSKPVRDATCECARDPDPSLSQVIHLLNNTSIVDSIKAGGGNIQRWLDEGRAESDIVERIFLATVSRRPTEPEREIIAKHLAGLDDRVAGLHDLQFALINSNEFLLRH